MTLEFTLTDILRPVPAVQKPRKTATPKIRLMCKGDKAWISAGLPIRRMLGLEPAKSYPMVVLASRAQIAISSANESDPNVRSMSTGGRINANELVELVHLKDGEVFEFPVAMENGMLVGPMPEAIFTRVGFMARKSRGASERAA